MKYFSMFSGIGGFEIGINNAWKNLQGAERSSLSSIRDSSSVEGRSNEQSQAWGDRKLQQPENIGYSEIDKYAIQIYEKHFGTQEETKQLGEEDAEGIRGGKHQPNNEGDKGLDSSSATAQQHIDRGSIRQSDNNTRGHKNYGNARDILTRNIPDFDLLVAGFPCQAFSIAGKRRGFDESRGTLFFEIARVLRDKRPRYFLLENVKGLLSHESGQTFQTILKILSDIGYTVQYQVLNSKNFGVPQNRERVFIVGHLRGTSRPEVFPIGEDDSVPSKKNEPDKRRTQATTCRPDIGRKADGTFINVTNARIRRLTPRECEKLQGFPVGWTERGVDIKGNSVIISDTQRYKTLGNAVSTPVITAIMEKLNVTQKIPT